MHGAHAADLIHTQRQRARDLAVDGQRPRRTGFHRQREMSANEKQIVARLEGPQGLDGRFGVERPSVADGEP